MGFWTKKSDRDPSGITPNANPETSVSPTWNPGDPDGVDTSALYHPVVTRSLPVVRPTPWDGWPLGWDVPNWDMGSRYNELIDVAWMCLDINSRILSTMPVYRTVAGEVEAPVSWMLNPDPTIYASWEEFAKQLFWDFQLGEVFVWSMAEFRSGLPMNMRVLPGWMVKVEMKGGSRVYTLEGSRRDITDEVLHIRYKSTTDGKHGVGPLESAGGRMLTAGVLARYIRELAQTGGNVKETLETDEQLTDEDVIGLMNQWLKTRAEYPTEPVVLDAGFHFKSHQAMTPRDMAMLEVAQFTEARIAGLLGVPPFLAGLPSSGGSGEGMTYANVSQVFDFHDRSALKPFAKTVMSALSNWALPPGQAAELNRDEYTRPDFATRAESWVKLVEAGIVTVDEVRSAERLTGPISPQALTGGTIDEEVSSGI